MSNKLIWPSKNYQSFFLLSKRVDDSQFNFQDLFIRSAKLSCSSKRIQSDKIERNFSRNPSFSKKERTSRNRQFQYPITFREQLKITRKIDDTTAPLIKTSPNPAGRNPFQFFRKISQRRNDPLLNGFPPRRRGKKKRKKRVVHPRIDQRLA